MTSQLPDDAITLAGRVIHWLTCGQCDYSPDDLTMVNKADREDATKVLAAALPALTGAITAQAAAAEREACARLLDRNSAFLRRQGRVERAETLERHADMIRARGDLLGGRADGAHTPGGAT